MNPGNAFANSLLTLCHQLRLNWTEIAGRLSAGHAQASVGLDQLYARWTSVEHAYQGDDFAFKAAELLADTPSHPALLACLCSPDLAVALQRFSQAVPAAGLSIASAEDEVTLSIDSQISATMPPSLQVAMLAYIVAAARRLKDAEFSSA